MGNGEQPLVRDGLSLQQESFQSESRLNARRDAMACSSNYDIEVHNLHLPTAGRGVYFSPSHCFLEYVAASEHELSVRYSVASKPRSVGQLIFVPPGVELEWQWRSGQQRTITCMFDVERMAMLAGYKWDWGNTDLSRTINIQNDYLLMGMRKLGEEACAPGFASELQIENMLAVMGVELHREFIGAGTVALTNDRKLSARELRLVREFIHDNLAGDISVAGIASYCEVSARDLSEQFKATLGLTLRQFVANTRIDRAKALLTNRQLLVKQIAFECGFKGAAAFVAAFRAASGVTPTAYRKTYC